jgi:hypothetical protein
MFSRASFFGLKPQAARVFNGHSLFSFTVYSTLLFLAKDAGLKQSSSPTNLLFAENVGSLKSVA